MLRFIYSKRFLSNHKKDITNFIYQKKKKMLSKMWEREGDNMYYNVPEPKGFYPRKTIQIQHEETFSVVCYINKSYKKIRIISTDTKRAFKKNQNLSYSLK